MRFVLDASVALAWLLRDTDARDEGYPSVAATVPATWGLEIANVIACSEAKELVTAAQSGSFLSLLDSLAIEADTDTVTHVLSDTLQLARRYRLSSYDASYLELALREGALLPVLI